MLKRWCGWFVWRRVERRACVWLARAAGEAAAGREKDAVRARMCVSAAVTTIFALSTELLFFAPIVAAKKTCMRAPPGAAKPVCARA